MSFKKSSISSSPSIKTYLNQKDFSFKGAINYLKKNKTLVFVSTFALLFIYGVRFSTLPYGVDTEFHLGGSRYINWLSIGRFGLVGLQKIVTGFLTGIELFSPFFSLFFALTFLLFGTFLWCYLLDFFSDGKISKVAMTAFALVLISHQVWVEQVYFVCQSAECLFIFFLSPLCVYFLIYGMQSANVKKVIFGALLSVFCISVYQGVVVLIYCAIFAFFLLYYENTNLSKKEYKKLCLSLLFVMCGIVLVYFSLNLIVKKVLGVESSSYLFHVVKTDSLLTFFKDFIKYIYKLTLANFLPENVVRFILSKFKIYDLEKINTLNFSLARLMSTVFLIPASIIAFIRVLKNKRKNFFTFASFFSIFILIVVCGAISPLRSHYELPFALAFIFLYATTFFKKNVYKVALVIFMLLGVRNSLTSSMLNYSDVIRYEKDVRLSQDIATRLYECGVDKNTPVLLYGMKGADVKENFICGEVCAKSSFEWCTDESKLESTKRGLTFMKTQGYEFTPVSESEITLIEKARAYALNMSDFPYTHSVVNLGDVAVVRLSETTFIEESEK